MTGWTERDGADTAETVERVLREVAKFNAAWPEIDARFWREVAPLIGVSHEELKGMRREAAGGESA